MRMIENFDCFGHVWPSCMKRSVTPPQMGFSSFIFRLIMQVSGGFVWSVRMKRRQLCSDWICSHACWCAGSSSDSSSCALGTTDDCQNKSLCHSVTAKPPNKFHFWISVALLHLFSSSEALICSKAIPTERISVSACVIYWFDRRGNSRLIWIKCGTAGGFGWRKLDGSVCFTQPPTAADRLLSWLLFHCFMGPPWGGGTPHPCRPWMGRGWKNRLFFIF